MSNTDLVKSALAAFESGDAKKADSLLSDDMVFAGPVPQPIGKHEFIGLQGALVAAIPDWKFNASEYKEQGDKVMLKAHISGTHQTIEPSCHGDSISAAYRQTRPIAIRAAHGHRQKRQGDADRS